MLPHYSLRLHKLSVVAGSENFAANLLSAAESAVALCTDVAAAVIGGHL